MLPVGVTDAVSLGKETLEVHVEVAHETDFACVAEADVLAEPPSRDAVGDLDGPEGDGETLALCIELDNSVDVDNDDDTHFDTLLLSLVVQFFDAVPTLRVKLVESLCDRKVFESTNDCVGRDLVAERVLLWDNDSLNDTVVLLDPLGDGVGDTEDVWDSVCVSDGLV
jgi:hypothetical protein